MTRTLTAKIALAISGSSSAAMGAYHFFLPSMFHWDRFVTKIPDSIQWALFSINFFFSYLLLAGGVLTLVALRRLHRSLPPDRGVLYAMAGFWLVNLLYQLIIPMPLPAKLWLLHLVLVGYAVLCTLAYVASLIALRND
jgi:hypothetical protein